MCSVFNVYPSTGHVGLIDLLPSNEQYCPRGQTLALNHGPRIRNITCSGDEKVKKKCKQIEIMQGMQISLSLLWKLKQSMERLHTIMTRIVQLFNALIVSLPRPFEIFSRVSSY